MSWDLVACPRFGGAGFGRCRLLVLRRQQLFFHSDVLNRDFFEVLADRLIAQASVKRLCDVPRMAKDLLSTDGGNVSMDKFH